MHPLQSAPSRMRPCPTQGHVPGWDEGCSGNWGVDNWRVHMGEYRAEEVEAGEGGWSDQVGGWVGD
jgi:hypothetical protein